MDDKENGKPNGKSKYFPGINPATGKPWGRPRKQEAEFKRIGAEFARKYIEDQLRPVLDAYLALGIGKKTGKRRRVLDPATTRHIVERFVPPAPKTVSLDLTESAESFYEKIMAEDESARNQRALDDGRAPEEVPEDETLH